MCFQPIRTASLRRKPVCKKISKPRRYDVSGVQRFR
jgi:hypothetical protein